MIFFVKINILGVFKMDKEIKNNIFFNKLKQENTNNVFSYPNLENLTIQKNYIILKKDPPLIVYLGNLELTYIDKSLFTLEEEEIIYILSNISNMINNPDYLQKKITYVDKVLELDKITEEHKSYIYSYLNDYHKRIHMQKKFRYNNDEEELREMIKPICKCYDDSEFGYSKNPAAVYLKDLEKQFAEQSLNNNENTKAKIKVRQNGHNTVSFEDENTLIHTATGFISATFIISIIGIIGIVLAIILYAINF